jgi:phospholipid-binding lipoprotein MlaA
MKYLLPLLFLFSIVLFSGCSTKSDVTPQQTTASVGADDEFAEFSDEFSEPEERSDPLRGYNEFMTDVNDKFYVYLFKPVAQGYSDVVPHGARQSVSNFFNNLLYPIRFINNVLQGKFANATEETSRFVINSIWGLAGLFDVASEMGFEAHEEDFGQTLGHWGVGSGYPLVLPFFGPSNIRDMVGMIPDSVANPVHYYGDRGVNLTKNSYHSFGASSYETINQGSLELGKYEVLKENALELYPYLQEVYEQHRNKLIEE